VLAAFQSRVAPPVPPFAAHVTKSNLYSTPVASLAVAAVIAIVEVPVEVGAEEKEGAGAGGQTSFV